MSIALVLLGFLACVVIFLICWNLPKRKSALVRKTSDGQVDTSMGSDSDEKEPISLHESKWHWAWNPGPGCLFTYDGDFLHIIPIIFNKDIPQSDYKIIAEDPTLGYLKRYTLFIYNENLAQFSDKEDLDSGGGNACIRKYRIDAKEYKEKPFKALGFVTGVSKDDSNNRRVDSNVVQQIMESHIEFAQLLVSLLPTVRNIVYCTGPEGKLGFHEFKDKYRCAEKFEAILRALDENKFAQVKYFRVNQNIEINTAIPIDITDRESRVGNIGAIVRKIWAQR